METDKKVNEQRDTYSDYRQLRSSIIYKRNELIEIISEYRFYKNFNSIPQTLFPKLIKNFCILYELIRPFFIPRKEKNGNGKHKDFKDKIGPLMDFITLNPGFIPTDEQLYKLQKDLNDFIHFLGISDLTMDEREEDYDPWEHMEEGYLK